MPDLFTAMARLTAEIALPDSWGPVPPGLLGVHHCDDGRTGVADLIGGEPAGPDDGR